GIDSSVCLALAVRGLGADRVLGVLLPEHDSSEASGRLATDLAAHFGVETVTEDLTDGLAGLGSYRRRDEAIRNVFPEYGEGYKSRITLPGNLLESGALNVFTLTIVAPDGSEQSKRVDPASLRQIIAATNFKQRTRTAMLYYHAERLHYAVVGTPNKNEHDQGFFVKWGDGAYDVAPIRHLFKTQVYQLAAHLGIPKAIQEATPTSDTYSAGATQEEFFFRLPFAVMDVLWLALESDVPAAEAAAAMDLTEEQVERVYRDLEVKGRNTEYLRTPQLHYG
ncbi:MAG: NAD(+) synthase, partial [Actinobacteria bacterium]